MSDEKDFRAELKQLLNFHSMENASNTPDVVLAEYLVSCLNAFDEATRQRTKWHGEEQQEKVRPGTET